MLSDPENMGIEEVFETHDKTFEKALRRPMDKHLMTIFDDKINMFDYKIRFYEKKIIFFDDKIMIKRSRKRCDDQ